MASLTKAQIAQRISEKIGTGTTANRNVIDAMMQVFEEELAAGNDVGITGYFKIKLAYRAGKRKGQEVRNPATGETRKLEEAIPAKITCRAVALKRLKEACPSPATKAGKPIADAAKAKAAARAAV